jgi:DNA-binding NarL/FixJ family response regulator
MPIRVLIADDHRLVRNGIRTLLQTQPDIEIVAEAENGRDAVRLAVERKPDAVLMDVSMPELNGIDAVRQIKKELKRSAVVVLSMHTDHEIVAEALSAGASAYLAKDCSVDELAEAVRKAVSGRSHLSAAVAHAIVNGFRKNGGLHGPEARRALSAREREVLQLIAEGKGPRQIASRLHISVKTVESHRAHIMEKLGIRTVAGLTKYAIRKGLTTLDA